MEDVVKDAVEEATQEDDVPLIFSNTNGLGHITEKEAKELDDVASQLRKASAMHKAQASKIDRMIKTMTKSKKK